MSGRLANKIAVIIGASSGIGRAIALSFASHGAKVVCSDLREQARAPDSSGNADTSIASTVSTITSAGGDAIFVKCDTSKADEVEALAKAAVQKYGRIDIMVNNAGISIETNKAYGPRPVWDYEEEMLDKTLDINVKGVLFGMKYASAVMKEQSPHSNGDRGWIINLSSIAGLRAAAHGIGYVASKHAVIGLTKAAALDCAPHRIHVNALYPGYTQTAFTAEMLQDSNIREAAEQRHPFRGLGTAQDIANGAVFLASEEASWVTGVGLPVDGGYTCL